MERQKEQNRSAFNRWAGFWSATTEPGRAMYAAVASRVDAARLRVLDVGCGTGDLSRLLVARHPERTVCGIDLAPQMVRKAAELSGDRFGPRLRFQEGDAEALPFADGSFDAVVNTLSFHHYPHPQQAMAEFARVLRPGGRVVLADPDGGHPLVLPLFWLSPLFARWSGREWRHTPAQMAAFCTGAGFQVLEQARTRWIVVPVRLFVAERR